jgi:hypothetical protein
MVGEKESKQLRKKRRVKLIVSQTIDASLFFVFFWRGRKATASEIEF